MVLNDEHRCFTVPHAFDRAIIEIDVSHFHIGRKTGWIDRKTMVLAGDADLTASQILDRLIAAAMAKFELEGLTAIGMS